MWGRGGRPCRAGDSVRNGAGWITLVTGGVTCLGAARRGVNHRRWVERRIDKSRRAKATLRESGRSLDHSDVDPIKAAQVIVKHQLSAPRLLERVTHIT